MSRREGHAKHNGLAGTRAECGERSVIHSAGRVMDDLYGWNVRDDPDETKRQIVVLITNLRHLVDRSEIDWARVMADVEMCYREDMDEDAANGETGNPSY